MRDKVPSVELRRRLGIEGVVEVIILRDKIPTVELKRRLGIEGVMEAMRRGRLRWFRHVERKEDWVSACKTFEVAGSRGRAGQK